MNGQRNRAPSFVLAATLAALAAPLGAQSAAAAPTPSTPEARVDAVFAAFDRTDSPGCAVGVYRDGRLAYARGYGMANLELHVGNSSETAFDIGSTAKQFAAFSILLLARDGKLSVDDDIRKYVPEIPDYGTRITIRHLLTHTSGLRDYLELMDLEGVREEDLTTEQDALDILSRQKALNFPPGSEHLYSNSGYFLLSIIVKRASGESLRDFAQERIFGPLGMTHTQYDEDHTRLISNRATGYAPREGGGFGISMSDFEQNGDGGILTTVEDLQRWDENFYQPRIGDPDLIARMQTPGKLNNGKALTYAFGLSVGKNRGLRTVSHGGAWVGYRAQLLRYPDQHFSVACLCNLSTSNPSRLASKIAEIYLGDLMEKEAAPPAAATDQAFTPSESDLAALAGAYRETSSGAVLFLSSARGRLLMEIEGERVPLSAAAPNRFESTQEGLSLLALPSPARRPRLEVREEGEGTRSFEPIDSWTPAAADLQAFAGAYASDEVAAVFRFTIKDGQLVLRHRTIPANPWKPTLKNSFSEGYRRATFQRDKAGKVTGFKLDAGRVRGIVFRKISGPGSLGG